VSINDEAAWHHFLATLERDEPELRRACGWARAFWFRVSIRSDVRLPLPNTMRSEIGVLLSWRVGAKHLDIDIAPDCQMDWFFRDSHGDVTDGSDDPVAELPDAFWQYAMQVSR